MQISSVSNSALYSSSARSGSPQQTGAASPSAGTNSSVNQLTPAQQQQLEQLQARDAEVRRHEQAHLSAAGGLAVSGANYSYQTGPDGKQYAVGGEVSIDVSPANTPEETLRKAAAIRAAALAPAQPSGPDRAIAAQASAMALTAQLEIAQATHAAQADASKISRSYSAPNTSGTDALGQILNVFA